MPGTGILGPRGWYCFGTYGSGGRQLFVSPEHIDDGNIFSRSWSGFAGPAIEVRYANGGGSGMTEVAEVIARAFPEHRAFAKGVMEEFNLKLTFGPFPTDVLTYKSKGVVEYKTPAQTEGLGTHSRLRKNAIPIYGVAIVNEQTYDLLLLSIRLPSELKSLTSVIMAQVESDARNR